MGKVDSAFDTLLISIYVTSDFFFFFFFFFFYSWIWDLCNECVGVKYYSQYRFMLKVLIKAWYKNLNVLLNLNIVFGCIFIALSYVVSGLSVHIRIRQSTHEGIRAYHFLSTHSSRKLTISAAEFINRE